ncbi:hypothetical protein QQS21_002257 [Conoideocrella luteorostrata]|uniref:Uncharacterized protein n=1 Tax=Conoideocrella luteorostrata TaxID=1105319 RepID=A0AAJ0CYB5_9HYPO|nr:hypothetical protein QQS21_002257 [Conoideocrella luteorostrata]
MSSLQKSTLKLHLTPQCDDSGDIVSILGNLAIGGLYGGLRGGRQHILHEPVFLASKKLTSQNDPRDLHKDDILAFENGDGPVDFQVRPVGDTELGVFAERQIAGDVSIQFRAHHVRQHANENDGSGLIANSGGLVGIGRFIPRPFVSTDYDISIVWELSHLPNSTRAITSLGEGNTFTQGTAATLQKCVFMVGKVKSYPENPAHGPLAGFCATYWLSELPPNLNALKDFSNAMFPHLSKFFNDTGGSYRAFLRKTHRGMQSVTGQASGLIDCDDNTEEASGRELVRLLNKAMVASWAQLDPEDDGTENDWFLEGLSGLYTIYLPFRFQLQTPDYFRETLNANLAAYFTNPLIRTPLDQYNPCDPNIWHVESILPRRSCIYMIRMDCFTRRASVNRKAGVERPIDEIVADICKRRRNGEKVQAKDWLKYIGDWIGHDEAAQHLAEMKAGKVLDLDDMRTAFGGSLDATEMPIMQMGFDKMSLQKGIVSGVVEKSAAHVAGLRDGDCIAWHSRVNDCEADCTKNFTIMVSRGGQDVLVGYLPRGDKMVKAWQSVKKRA